jgi:hypothetical protein
MSRFFLAVGVLGFIAAESHAAEKFAASNATCERVKGLIARDGEVVLRFPSSRVAGMTLYDRYVQNDRRCESNDMTISKFVATADHPRCELSVCSPNSDSKP